MKKFVKLTNGDLLRASTIVGVKMVEPKRGSTAFGIIVEASAGAEVDAVVLSYESAEERDAAVADIIRQAEFGAWEQVGKAWVPVKAAAVKVGKATVDVTVKAAKATAVLARKGWNKVRAKLRARAEKKSIYQKHIERKLAEADLEAGTPAPATA